MNNKANLHISIIRQNSQKKHAAILQISLYEEDKGYMHTPKIGKIFISVA